MSSIFLYPKSLSGECYKSEFRTINQSELKTTKLKPLEILISTDYRTGEILLGRPLFTKTTKYKGKLYEKLMQLNLPLKGELNKKDKDKIIKFISDYGLPLSSHTSLEGQLNTNNGSKINWAFIPYQLAYDTTSSYFFYTFRNMYVDFIETIEIIRSGNLKLLNSYQGTFNIGLEGNKLMLPNFPLNKNSQLPKWISNTCLNLCYLELYELLVSNQTIKVCKYCGKLFESSKNNEVRCKDCKNPAIFRKLYYQKNIKVEREKGRKRMEKLRKKEKSLVK